MSDETCHFCRCYAKHQCDICYEYTCKDCDKTPQTSYRICPSCYNEDLRDLIDHTIEKYIERNNNSEEDCEPKEIFKNKLLEFLDTL